MSNTNKQLTFFLDNIGRTIIGKITNQDDSILSVENPALVHIHNNPQTNQLQLQLLPLFFKEFQANKSDPTVWNFKKANITIPNEIEVAAQFLAQYEQMFQTIQQAPQESGKVVKLFDDE